MLYFNLCTCCRVAVCVMCLLLVVPWVGLWSLIVIFTDHRPTYMFSAKHTIWGKFNSEAWPQLK